MGFNISSDSVTVDGNIDRLLSLDIEEWVNQSDNPNSILQIGDNQHISTSDTLTSCETALRVDSGSFHGFSSIPQMYGSGEHGFAYKAAPYAVGDSHNQLVGYLALINQRDGEPGELPPSVAFYSDSRHSTVRPWAVLVDDELSSWDNGIVLNGDYKETVIRHDKWLVKPDGTTERGGGIETSRVEVTTNHTTKRSEELLGTDTTGGAVTITLDKDSLRDGHRKTIKDEGGVADASNITIKSEGGELIDDKQQVTIKKKYGWITVYSNGKQWFTIRHPPKQQ
jgi:hypothetical protein